MDWTTPLKFLQIDFVKRLKKQKALEPTMLDSKVRGCHSEIMSFWGEQLIDMQRVCQQEADKLAKNPPSTPPEYNLWVDFREHFQYEAYEYLIREQLVDAIIDARLGKQVKKVKIDPLSNMELDEEGNLRNESKFTYTLTDEPTVRIQIHLSDHESFNSLKKDKVRWSVTQNDLKNNQVLVFMCLFGLAYTNRGSEIDTLLAGFLLTEQIEISGPKTYIKLADMLYAGGLGCYLESFNTANIPPKEQILIPETIQKLPSNNSLTIVVGGWKCSHTLTGHTSGINSLAISLSGEILASGSRGEIRLWDLTTGQLISTLSEYPWVKSWETDEVHSLAFSPDGYTLVSGGVDCTLKIWHTGAKDLIDILEQHSGAVRCLGFSPGGETLASGGEDRKILLWNRSRREAFSTISWGDGVPHSLAFSANGHLLASGSYRKIKVWRLEDENGSLKAKLLHTLSAHSHIVSTVVFSPDDRTLISSSRDGTIKLWNLETGELISTLKEDMGAVYAIALSSDGQTIASGCEDKTVRLWHRSSGELLGTFTGHSSQVNAVAFSPDGLKLVSASQDKTIKIWQRG